MTAHTYHTHLLLLLFIVACVFFILPTGTSAATNLIANPSVENGNRVMPNDWSREKYGRNVSVFYYDHQNGYHENKSLSIDVIQYVTGHSGWFFSPVLIDDRTSYTYSAMYKAEMETEVVARYFFPDNSSVDVVVATVPPMTDWTRATTILTPPRNATKVAVMHRAKGLGKVVTDDFSLTATNENDTGGSEGEGGMVRTLKT